jgi:DNA-binding response OmpR family regulator/curved DNA-binding protein CbpA
MAGSPPYLLVVESDPDLQRRIGETLREASYELATEAEGAWAKRSVLIRPPDGLIIDTGLADGSGFAVADALRADPETADVPIVFVASRFRGAKHRIEARRRYAPAEYLPTPLDLDTFLARVLEVIPPRPDAPPHPVPGYPGIGAAGKLADTAAHRERRAVEEEARSLSSRAAELRGALARTPFARVLQRIYAEKRTGALLLARGSTKKIVYFRDGYPVFVRSNVLGECLGQILLARRLISREVLEESLHRMRSEKRHQGEILVEMGALSPHNLQRALIAQLEAKLEEIFSWDTGTFRFAEDRQPPDQPLTLERPPAGLILDGIRRYYGPDRQAAALAAFEGQYVARSEDPLQRLQNLSGDPAERHFVESIDGSRRLQAVLDAAPISAREARVLLVAMAEAGMIVPSRTPIRRPAHDQSHGRAQSSSSREEAEVEDIELRPPERRSREELAALYEGLLILNHFDTLGVSEDAGQVEIDRAYETRAREFHPDRFRRQTSEVREIAQKIFERFAEAHGVLADANQRRKYLARLERERAEPPPVVAGHSPPAAAEQVYYTGVDHLRQRRYREAAEAFRQAIALAPTQPSYHGALGWAIYRSAPTDPGAVTAGLHALERAVELGDDDPWVHVSLGRFFAETGAPERAIREFESALRINPSLDDVEQEIRRLRGEA